MLKDKPPAARLFIWLLLSQAIGAVISFLGFLTLGSTFVFGTFSAESHPVSFGLKIICGLLLFFGGAIFTGVSFLVLIIRLLLRDPQQIRKEMEPYNRARGGMISDTLDEVEILHEVVDKLGTAQPPQPATVKIRCRACQTLNEETAKFCQQCGGIL